MRVLAIFLLTVLLSSTTLAQNGPPLLEVAVGSVDSSAISISNFSGDPLRVSFAISDGRFFRVSDTTSRLLAPGETSQLYVLFSPPSAGLFVDVITFTYLLPNGDEVGDQKIDLQGMGLGADVKEKMTLSFTFWPNPASEQITFTEMVETVAVVDILGNTVKTGSNVYDLNIRDLATGRYFVRSGDGRLQPLLVK